MLDLEKVRAIISAVRPPLLRVWRTRMSVWDVLWHLNRMRVWMLDPWCWMSAMLPSSGFCYPPSSIFAA